MIFVDAITELKDMNNRDRLKIIYFWVEQREITFKTFKDLLNYFWWVE